jgi:hypothetical protein
MIGMTPLSHGHLEQERTRSAHHNDGYPRAQARAMGVVSPVDLV